VVYKLRSPDILIATCLMNSSARLVDEQVAKEVASSLRTGIMKNKQTTLFHQQNRANQRLISMARKTHKETTVQDSLSNVQSRIDSEKIIRQQSLFRQREYEASLKALTENGAVNSRMSIALFEETSLLRKKIDDEKNLRRRSTITRSSLADELSEISASASGKLGTGIAKRLPKVVIPEDIEASSSGRVSDTFARIIQRRVTRVNHREEVESYSDGTHRSTRQLPAMH
jgi:hypothetical protein